MLASVMANAFPMKRILKFEKDISKKLSNDLLFHF